jgi:UDP-N-acetylmuramate dehydrogenase
VRAGLRHGFGPMRALAGLPGSIGGALAMNAQNIGSYVHQITLVSPEGLLDHRVRAGCDFDYRYADLGGGVVVAATLKFTRAVDPQDAADVRAVLQQRRTTQELTLPSAGCAFKNPTRTLSAGALIDRSGLKGWSVGDARVSSKHANFIVNTGRSRSLHILRLMERIQRRVRRDHQVWLEPEIRIVGERIHDSA